MHVVLKTRYVNLNIHVRSPNFSATRPQLLSIREATTIDPERIDWGMLEDLGLSREKLEVSGELEKMLSWQKSDLLPHRRTLRQ